MRLRDEAIEAKAKKPKSASSTNSSKRSSKRLGSPVSYPEGHPYNDPRERTRDALGMLGALRRPRTGNRETEIEDKVREFVGFMWAVEGRELNGEEIAKYRLGLMRDD